MIIEVLATKYRGNNKKEEMRRERKRGFKNWVSPNAYACIYIYMYRYPHQNELSAYRIALGLQSFGISAGLYKYIAAQNKHIHTHALN